MTPRGDSEGRIAVSIIEDQAEVREGLATLIGSTSGFRCAGRFRSMERALEEIERDMPDVLLVDLGLPAMSGVDGIARLRVRYPALPLLVLTVHHDDDRVFGAICAGASGYLLKTTPPDRLIEGLREVLDGGSPISAQVARRVIALFRELRPPERASYRLTRQESELLKLIVDGHHYKTAANVLGISVNTISYHLRNIYQKLHVHSKSEAVSRAIREHLV